LLARGASLSDLHEQINAYRTARAAAGFDAATAHIQVTRGFYTAESEDAAWREAEQGIRRHYRRLARYGNEEVGLTEMARRGDFIIGTPAQCAEQIAALCAELPITHLACDISLTGTPHELIARSLDLLGHEMIPRLRACFTTLAQALRQRKV
jgi:alkanesulfonate monooxygenase SsuD/methylene tetrahydromethanopterin reductase-like flavin-dependent oxidoreductase (luciferase family)